DPVARAGEVRLEEVGRDRPSEQRDPRREAELARAAEEVVVAPARERADLLFGIVADAGAHLVRRPLDDAHVEVDARVAALVLVDAHGAEEAEPDDVRARLLDEALLERITGFERDFPPYDGGIEGRRTGHLHRAE